MFIAFLFQDAEKVLEKVVAEQDKLRWEKLASKLSWDTNPTPAAAAASSTPPAVQPSSQQQQPAELVVSVQQTLARDTVVQPAHSLQPAVADKLQGSDVSQPVVQPPAAAGATSMAPGPTRIQHNHHPHHHHHHQQATVQHRQPITQPLMSLPQVIHQPLHELVQSTHISQLSQHTAAPHIGLAGAQYQRQQQHQHQLVQQQGGHGSELQRVLSGTAANVTGVLEASERLERLHSGPHSDQQSSMLHNYLEELSMQTQRLKALQPQMQQQQPQPQVQQRSLLQNLFQQPHHAHPVPPYSQAPGQLQSSQLQPAQQLHHQPLHPPAVQHLFQLQQQQQQQQHQGHLAPAVAAAVQRPAVQQAGMRPASQWPSQYGHLSTPLAAFVQPVTQGLSMQGVNGLYQSFASLGDQHQLQQQHQQQQQMSLLQKLQKHEQQQQQQPLAARLWDRVHPAFAMADAVLEQQQVESPVRSHHSGVQLDDLHPAYAMAHALLDDHLDADNECVVCMTAVKNACCIPCGHVCMCQRCAADVQEQSGVCPVCRATLECVIEILH